ncbi:MAG: response regulator [Planctomycetaceae bacterium]|nr:response regulator [Planctomycetaceae bacterium]
MDCSKYDDDRIERRSRSAVVPRVSRMMWRIVERAIRYVPGAFLCVQGGPVANDRESIKPEVSGTSGNPSKNSLSVFSSRTNRSIHGNGWDLAPILFGVGVGLFTLISIVPCVWLAEAVAKNVVKETLDEELTTVVKIAAQRLDWAAHRQLKHARQQNDESYKAVVQPFREILQVSPNLRFIYTVRESEAGLVWIADAAEPIDGDGDGVIDQANLGEAVEEPDSAMLAAFATQSVQVSESYYEDQWGKFISAYAPVFDPSGRLECVVGVDTTAQNYIARLSRIHQVARVALSVGLALSLTSGVLAWFVQRMRLAADKQALDLIAANSAILGTVQDAVVLCDLNADIVDWNQQAEELFGYRRTDVLGQNFIKTIFPREIQQSIQHELDVFFVSGSSKLLNGQTALTALHRNSRLFPVDLTIRQITISGKTRLCIFLRDLTAQRQYEAALESSKNAAEAANRSKSTFLANMSHEIRTPMTAISGYAELLCDSSVNLTEQQTIEYAQTIFRNGQHLLQLIDDILDLSKVEAGKVEIEEIPTRIDQVLSDVESLMKRRAQAAKLELENTRLTALPAVIYSDPNRIRQVLVNLVGNAIKFTKSGKVTIETRMLNLEAAPELEIVVVDTGIGMSPEQLSRLFSPFTQADNSTTRKFGGTGLGLCISRSYAELLGGSLTVDSRLGEGSRFTLRFPARIQAGTEFVPAGAGRPTASLTERPSVPRQVATPLSGRTILLAEDGPDNQALIAFHLRRAGAQVTIVDNGRLALETLTIGGSIEAPLNVPAFDLVITDMQMPEMDGYHLAAALRRKGWDRPIIALTAHAMSGDEAKCISAGCDAFATKPIQRDVLIRTCVSALEKSKASQLDSVGTLS